MQWLRGTSCYSDAEGVNAAETVAIAKGGTVETDDYAVPTSAAQLTANKRKFQLAITSALRGAKYACTPVVPLASYPGCPGESEHTSPSQREALPRKHIATSCHELERLLLALVERVLRERAPLGRHAIERACVIACKVHTIQGGGQSRFDQGA